MAAPTRDFVRVQHISWPYFIPGLTPNSAPNSSSSPVAISEIVRGSVTHAYPRGFKNSPPPPLSPARANVPPHLSSLQKPPRSRQITTPWVGLWLSSARSGRTRAQSGQLFRTFDQHRPSLVKLGRKAPTCCRIGQNPARCGHIGPKPSSWGKC